jgi:hypothetical protein
MLALSYSQLLALADAAPSSSACVKGQRDICTRHNAKVERKRDSSPSRGPTNPAAQGEPPLASQDGRGTIPWEVAKKCTVLPAHWRGVGEEIVGRLA